MALFNFLKQKPAAAIMMNPTASNNHECDINKTKIITELLKLPPERRDKRWQQSLYQNVATASFACATPQTLTGPDGFTYFILKTPEVNKHFESFCIQNMKDDFLLNNGWGVVINPLEDKSAAWVLNYGSIVNLHLNHELWSEDETNENIEFTKTVGVIKKGEKVMIAQPSESYLPKATRHALKTFLQSKGIVRPKIAMLTSNNNGKLVRKLAFNIHPENYPVASNLDYLMQQVGWFLPNTYLLVPLSKNTDMVSDLSDM